MSEQQVQSVTLLEQLNRLLVLQHTLQLPFWLQQIVEHAAKLSHVDGELVLVVDGPQEASHFGNIDDRLDFGQIRAKSKFPTT